MDPLIWQPNQPVCPSQRAKKLCSTLLANQGFIFDHSVASLPETNSKKPWKWMVSFWGPAYFQLLWLFVLGSVSFLVGGFFLLFWKICSSNWIISPGFRGEKKKIWKHHLGFLSFRVIFHWTMILGERVPSQKLTAFFDGRPFLISPWFTYCVRSQVLDVLATRRGIAQLTLGTDCQQEICVGWWYVVHMR